MEGGGAEKRGESNRHFTQNHLNCSVALENQFKSRALDNRNIYILLLLVYMSIWNIDMKSLLC